MYWHQGFYNAPEIVRLCVKQCQLLNSGWSIKLLDSKNISDYVEPLALSASKLNQLCLAHRSDLIRTQLLIKYGGVWMDPTCYCVCPLDEWLPQYFTSDIFMFYRPGRDRIISNWFIAAVPHNKLLVKLLDGLVDFWGENEFSDNNNKAWYLPAINRILSSSHIFTRLWFSAFITKVLRIYPYMIYHYKVFDLISTDRECKSMFDSMPKYSAVRPHTLQQFGLTMALTLQAKNFIDSKETPIHKLNWKIDLAKVYPDTTLGYLLQSEHL